MFNTFETYQAEVEYRANKIRREIGRSRRVRNPFVRKPAQATGTTR